MVYDSATWRVINDNFPDGKALLLVLVILLSNSISHKQLRAPAAAAAKAPPPKVQISFGEDKGHSSVKAIPPKVVASKRGSNLGFATSSQGGKVNLFLEGTTSSLIEDL